LKKCQEKSLELTTNSLTFARIARGESEKVLSAILLNKEADRTLLQVLSSVPKLFVVTSDDLTAEEFILII